MLPQLIIDQPHVLFNDKHFDMVPQKINSAGVTHHNKIKYILKSLEVSIFLIDF